MLWFLNCKLHHVDTHMYIFTFTSHYFLLDLCTKLENRKWKNSSFVLFQGFNKECTVSLLVLRALGLACPFLARSQVTLCQWSCWFYRSILRAVYFLAFTNYLLIWISELQNEKERQRGRKDLPVTGLQPWWPQGLERTRVKSGSRNFSQLAHVVVGAQGLGLFSSAFPGVVAEEGIGIGSSWNVNCCH